MECVRFGYYINLKIMEIVCRVISLQSTVISLQFTEHKNVGEVFNLADVKF